MSKISKPAILVVSWDGAESRWMPFFRLFDTYWPECPYQIYLGTNTKMPDIEQVTPVPVGPDKSYSDNLDRMLRSLSEEWVIIWIDDLFLSRRVSEECLINAINWGIQNKVDRLQLYQSEWSIIPQGTVVSRDPRIVAIPEGAPYRVNLMTALWRKRRLIRLLKSGENPWKLERRGTMRAQRCDLDSYILMERPNAMEQVNAVWRGQWTREGLNVLVEDGYSGLGTPRKVEGLGSYWFRKIYSVVRYLIFRLVGMVNKSGQIYSFIPDSLKRDREWWLSNETKEGSTTEQ